MPLGIYRHRGRVSVGTAIGDRVFDLRELVGELTELNPMMAWPAGQRRELRREISRQLLAGARERPELLVPACEAELLLPARIGDYTDFYASIYHANKCREAVSAGSTAAAEL